MRDRKYQLIFLLSLFAAFILSFYGHDGGDDWFWNIFPLMVPLLVLIITYQWFRFTPLVYFLIWVFTIVLLYGAHYNYYDPFFNWLETMLTLKRNDFDRVSHFVCQGFVPAIAAREILLRKTPLQRGKMLTFLVLCICLAFSALHEIMEMIGAKVTGQSAEVFLGMQGDEWDTQWDMTSCFLGSIISLLVMSRMHDRALAQLESETVKVWSPSYQGQAQPALVCQECCDRDT